jgi:hypothetical protein
MCVNPMCLNLIFSVRGVTLALVDVLNYYYYYYYYCYYYYYYSKDVLVLNSLFSLSGTVGLRFLIAVSKLSLCSTSAVQVNLAVEYTARLWGAISFVPLPGPSL